MLVSRFFVFFFFFNDTATTDIYTLSLHDALPIFLSHGGLSNRDRNDEPGRSRQSPQDAVGQGAPVRSLEGDRKSTRLNSSHGYISYAVFCLKKKTNQDVSQPTPARSPVRHTPADL